MICRLIDFALVILELLMFKVCGVNGISKIEFFNFSCNKRVNKTIIIIYYFLFQNQILSSESRLYDICNIFNIVKNYVAIL